MARYKYIQAAINTEYVDFLATVTGGGLDVYILRVLLVKVERYWKNQISMKQLANNFVDQIIVSNTIWDSNLMLFCFVLHASSFAP